MSELSSMAKATSAYYAINERYPNDVDRGVPAGITELMNGTTTDWPTAPCPNSVYDYDKWTDGLTGEDVVQMSIRFCPIDAVSLSQYSFPREPWAVGFQKDSSYYWCIKGSCKAHSSQPINYPGKCANCKN